MNGLTCQTIKDGMPSKDGEVFRCSVKWDDNLEGLTAAIVKNYTETFLDHIESNVTHNVQRLGSPAIAGTHADGIIPEDEQARKAEINDYVTQEFANDIIPSFKEIAKDGVYQTVSKAFANITEDTPASQLETMRKEVSKSIFTDVQKMLGVYVDGAWAEFKDSLNGDYEKSVK